MADKLFKDVTTQYGGGMKFNEGFQLKISGAANAVAIAGLIVQNLDIGIQRPVTTLYDLTSNAVYYVSGRTLTQMSVQKVCGPHGVVKSFYEKLGDVCNAGQNNMWFKFLTGCENLSTMQQEVAAAVAAQGGGANTLVAKNCILTNVAFSCNVQNYVIYDNCQIQGTELELENS